jgi:hypothetical protein
MGSPRRHNLARQPSWAHRYSMLLSLVLAVACSTGPVDDGTVEPGPPAAVAALDDAVLRPESSALAPGESQGFRVRAADGSLIPSSSVVYSVTGGTINPRDFRVVYTAGSTAGSYEVRAVVGGRTLTSVVTIGGTAPGDGGGTGGGDTGGGDTGGGDTGGGDTGGGDPAPSAGSCLNQSGPLITLSGTQSRFDKRDATAANTKFDARQAWWTGTTAFPVLFGTQQTPGICWSGGRIQGGWSGGTSWSTYHSSAGLFSESPNATVEDVTISNYGDAIRQVDYAENWTIRRMHVVDAHDDCVENDRLYAGLIEDALFEGCYVFLSSRPGSGVELPVNGSNKVVTIRSTLVWHKPMPSVYRGPTPGTGPLFKWSPTGNQLAIHNSIFRVDQVPNHGDLEIPNIVSCSNNTIVWLGAGSYPARLPACFRVTTDKSVWDQAVAAWKTQHR